MNLLNIVVLIYAIMGVVSALMFGLKTIASEEEKGGFYLSDLRTFGLGFAVSCFLSSLLLISHKPLALSTLAPFPGAWRDALTFMLTSNILPVALCLSFFTLFYKYAAPKKTTLRQGFVGASAFVASFLVGKSFYWVYLLYSKEALAQSWGNFYGIFIAVFWVYFLICSFFYGASVAYVDQLTVYGRREADQPEEVIPTIPRKAA
jgi:membrane protein